MVSGEAMLGERGRLLDEQAQATRRTREALAISRTWTRVVVVANRAPFSHRRQAGGEVVVTRSASGLVTALEPLIEACSGTWVAHGSGDGDPIVVDANGRLNVPPANPRYQLRYVWLSEAEHQGYYDGFANEGLWPLCHLADEQPSFRARDFLQYRVANARFAAAASEEAAGVKPLVLVQDYHFALAPRMLRARKPVSTIVGFWHIPWPDPRVLQTCPWASELIDGLLGSDLLGFQTVEDCSNFLSAAESLIDSEVDHERRMVRHGSRLTHVRAYPVGVQWANRSVRSTQPSTECRRQICQQFGLPADARVVVGIDRLDYTKGIPEKISAVQSLLERQPELVGRFAFIQVAEPSRSALPAYQRLRTRVLEAQDRVNARFGTPVQPIRVLERHHDLLEVFRLYRAADVCYVGSLQDGMNLVAKEFVCARDDRRGVLVLSRFAGAAQQLEGALLINPYDRDQAAAVLARALAMAPGEQSRRMKQLRTTVAAFDASWWAHRLMHDAKSLEPRVTHPEFNRRLIGELASA
jgi:trehalose 6-phosphate synthase